jgi:hypothetical protein
MRSNEISAPTAALKWLLGVSATEILPQLLDAKKDPNLETSCRRKIGDTVGQRLETRQGHTVK